MPSLRIDGYAIARLEFSFEDFPRQRILKLLLDCPFQRTRAVNRIKTDIAEQIERLLRQGERKLTFRQTLGQIFRLNSRDLADLRLLQRAEHDDLVEPIDELRPEMRLHDAHPRRLHLRVFGFGIAGALLAEL